VANVPRETEAAVNGLTIVTGGAGFVGSHLVRQLVQSGGLVRVLEKPGATVGHLAPSVEVVFADIRDRRKVAAAVKHCRWVYHLAANPNLWAKDRNEFESINHQGTVNVLESAVEAGAERILHTSTESILTRSRSNSVLDENSVVAESDAVGPYCLSKLRAENAALRLARAGRPVLVANPTMPIGSEDRGMSPPTRLIRDFCLGHLPVVMDCTLNIIDVRDVATGLIRVFERGQPGRRYLVSGENLTLAGFLGMISEFCGVPVPRLRIPYFACLAVAQISELWADHITGQAPKATVTGVRLARRTLHFDDSRTRNELGLSPRPVREAIADAVQWLHDSGQITLPRLGRNVPTGSAPDDRSDSKP
jgi:dihydroflavonol-4-reductase